MNVDKPHNVQFLLGFDLTSERLCGPSVFALESSFVGVHLSIISFSLHSQGYRELCWSIFINYIILSTQSGIQGALLEYINQLYHYLYIVRDTESFVRVYLSIISFSLHSQGYRELCWSIFINYIILSTQSGIYLLECIYLSYHSL